MQFQVFTDQPAWFWLLCVAGGVAFAMGMYWRERKVLSYIENRWLRRGMFAARCIASTLLLFLLLDPFIKSSSNETEKPVVVMLQDNSASIGNALTDSVAYLKQWRDLQTALGDDFDVRMYPFGEQLGDESAALNFQSATTNMSQAIQSINNLYEHVHVAGVIVASDGLYNSGSNPLYIKNEVSAPIYTIGLGDTTQKKDARVLRALHNNIVYLNDRFSVQADIEAIFCQGVSLRISLTEVTGKSNAPLGSVTLPADAAQFTGTAGWEVVATTPGMHHYRISIQPVDGEHTTANNVQELYVEVLDARQKVLILANAPHPDIQALRQSIDANMNYSVDVQLAGTWKGSVNDYDLVILHQLPSLAHPVSQALQDIRTRQIPAWFITGEQTHLPAFNKAQSLVSINSNGQSANEVTALVETQFNVFSLDMEMTNTLPRLPALAAPYGQYSVSPAAQILAFQKIGNVGTKSPLWVVSAPGGEKTAVLCAENYWRWRLYDYVLNNNHTVTDGLVSKTIQYLAVKNDKKQFRVNQTRSIYNETESIVLDAELYNDSYELTNTPDATITITDEQGKDFPFQFSKTQNSYTLQAGYFPAGSYTYNASATLNGKQFTDAGAFSILPVTLETINTTANHQLLNQMAVQTGGTFVHQNDIAQLENIIRESTAAKPIMREITRTQSVIHLKWIFAILLILLSAEWFVRKFMGGY